MNPIKNVQEKRDDAVFPTVTLSVAMETSGRISNLSKLLCMSSLPANMKKIKLKIAENI